MSWVIDGTNDGFPYPDSAAALPNEPIAQVYPLILWRITPGVNDGFPYFLLQPPEAPPVVLPVVQRPYICVYAKDTDKLNFAGNGLAILIPTKCEVTDTLNGMKSVQMVHPIDPEKRHELLIINNILKVDGQLYTIKTVDTQYTGNSGSVSVYAEHIFYQMNDGWIFPVTYLYGSSGQGALNNIASHVDYQAREGAHIFAFQGSSDITMETPFRREVDAGCTQIDALLGSGGFIEKLGGELYRDNFYFSINSRMENSSDTAYDIRVGKNESGVKRTIDTTSMATYFRAYDAWGGWFAVAWDFEAFFGDLFPHYVVRSANFSAPQNAEDEGFDYDTYFNEVLIPETYAFFAANCKPIIRYEINMQDVRQNPDFEIVSGETFRVGDKGTLYDERLGGTLTIEITETIYDAIACRVTNVTVGDRQSFVSTASPLLVVDITPAPVATNQPVMDSSGALCFDASGDQIFEERSAS